MTHVMESMADLFPAQSRVEMLRSQKEFYERRCHELASGRGQSMQAQDGVESAINNANGYNTMVSSSLLSCSWVLRKWFHAMRNCHCQLHGVVS